MILACSEQFSKCLFVEYVYMRAYAVILYETIKYRLITGKEVNRLYADEIVIVILLLSLVLSF